MSNHLTYADGQDYSKTGLVATGSETIAPKETALFENYPNPFNPTTVIRYNLAQDGKVSLKVYNVLGQVVRTLVDGIETAGYKNVTFDASNLPSGVYFYRFEAGRINLSIKKMLLLK